MIRCFESEKIQNVNKSIDPIRDLEIIETEMMLADLESIQKRLSKNNKKNLENNQQEILEMALKLINENKDLNLVNEKFDADEIKMIGLLSLKPKLYVCNVDEESIKNGNSHTDLFIKKFGGENTIIISADIENQINQVQNEEKKKYMEMFKVTETGLDLLIKKAYKKLQLETFFTSGPKESRAWTMPKNCFAPKAAGIIHSDFEKGFIRSETISYNDFIQNNGWVSSKQNGKMRLEGKDYMVQDGDILNFRFNT